MNIWSRPPGGFTQEQRRQRRKRHLQVEVAVLIVVVVGLSGVLSFRWVTKVNPVDRSHAIDLYRAEQAVVAGADSREPQNRDKPDQRRRHREPEAQNSERRRRHGADVPAPAASSELAQRQPRLSPGQPAPHQSPRQEAAAPTEGVYSWATEGHEQVGGARRDFPPETQRIITAGEADTWNQHHYFSEDRQIWSAFRSAPSGVEITQQRNKVSFGPVTRESKIDFRPPMLAAPRSLRVGFEWYGEWSGETYGTYSGRVFERTTMAIGDHRVEVWGMTYIIDLRGEQEGRVSAEVWFAPDRGLTVKEHYVQDVRSGGAAYHAEWSQTLKSLEPRQ